MQWYDALVFMDKQLKDSTTFGVTISSAASGSSQIMLDTNNTLSWGINDCSSSFQSVSSCETLESYEHNAISTESPQIIVVPSDNQITGTVLADVRIPLIKECSIRIDQLNMSSAHFNDMNVENVIELPFSTNCSADYSKDAPYSSGDDSPDFEGFGEESFTGTEYEMYKQAVSLLSKNFERVASQRLRERRSGEPVSTHQQPSGKKEFERRQPERKTKKETVKRPRQYKRKIVKPMITENQIEPNNQSRIENTEANLPTCKQSNIVTSVLLPESNLPNCKQSNIVTSVLLPERISPIPVENVDIVGNNKNSTSDSSDAVSVVAPAAVDNSATKKKPGRSADIKNNNKQKELKKIEKIRKKREINLIADRIREHWREAFAAAKRKQRKKGKKSKIEKYKYKNDDTKRHKHRGQRKRKKKCYSSDSDSSDSSDTDTSKTTSSSSDSSSDSDTTSYTSQTSHTSQTRTDSDSTDSSDSDSSVVRHRHKHRYNRRTRSPSTTSDTSDTSSDDTFNKRKKYHSLKKILLRKRSNSRADENCAKLKKRRYTVTCRPDELFQKKMTKNCNRPQADAKRTSDRTIFSQKQQKSNYPPKSKGKNFKSETESTSAGDFSVKKMLF